MIDAHEHGLGRALHRLEKIVGALEPERMVGADAARLLDLVIRTKRVCGAVETLLAARVQETNAWRAEGHRSAAHWLAAHDGGTVSAAVDTLTTGQRLAECPRTAQAFRAGELSETQACEISAAVVADPSAETDLLEAAGREAVSELRDRCRAVRAAADPDNTDRYRRIHATRSLRQWTDRDGAGCGMWRTTPDAHAKVWAAIEAELEHVFAEARAEGRHESRDAYAMDALVALAAGMPAKAKGVQVVVHHTPKPDGDAAEHCEVRGVGPIPTSVARGLVTDAVVTAVLQDGADVTHVAHFGRAIPANLRRALEIRDPVCSVPGCGTRDRLEIDHLTPFALGGPASLDNLVRLCRWHHRQKHHEGYRLTGTPGDWQWRPPDRNRKDEPALTHAPP